MLFAVAAFELIRLPGVAAVLNRLLFVVFVLNARFRFPRLKPLWLFTRFWAIAAWLIVAWLETRLRAVDAPLE